MEKMTLIENGGITSARGFMAQGVCAEIKKKDKKDLAVVYSDRRGSAAAVYTTNKVRAACIDVTRENLADGLARAIVVNSGNANACTGEQGYKDAKAMTQILADVMGMGVNREDVIVGSTGVIGVPLPMDKVEGGIYEAVITMSRAGGHNAALAIMTTDLKCKEIAVEIEIQGKPVRIGGMAKGSGMIHPDMATMLVFITTDAAIDSKCLQKLVKASADLSFNMISVDRDTSTNDMLAVLSNGLAGNPAIEDENSEDAKKFAAALNYVNTELAKMIARDGEGANHLIEVQVVNAADKETARKIARSVTASNLTKAAVFGHDPNWGRIMCAAGYSGAEFDPSCVDVYLGTIQVARDGRGLAFDEAQAVAAMQQENVVITLDLKAGEHSAIAWGCDLSYDYVRINADYRS